MRNLKEYIIESLLDDEEDLVDSFEELIPLFKSDYIVETPHKVNVDVKDDSLILSAKGSGYIVLSPPQDKSIYCYFPNNINKLIVNAKYLKINSHFECVGGENLLKNIECNAVQITAPYIRNINFTIYNSHSSFWGTVENSSINFKWNDNSTLKFRDNHIYNLKSIESNCEKIYWYNPNIDYTILNELLIKGNRISLENNITKKITNKNINSFSAISQVINNQKKYNINNEDLQCINPGSSLSKILGLNKMKDVHRAVFYDNNVIFIFNKNKHLIKQDKCIYLGTTQDGFEVFGVSRKDYSDWLLYS